MNNTKSSKNNIVFDRNESKYLRYKHNTPGIL